MSSDDLFDFSVTEHEPETYKPSVIVKQLHGFYHYGSSDFDVKDSSYVESILGFFAVTVAIGMLLMCCVWTINICACFSCFRNWMCRCCFKNHFSSEQSKRHGHVGRMILIGLFVLSATIMSLSYIAYGKLSGALESFSESVEKLGDVFWTMEEASLGLCNQKGARSSQVSVTKMKSENRLYDGYNASIRLSDCALIDAVSFDGFYDGTEILKETLDGVSDNLYSFASKLTGEFSSVLFYFLSGLTLLYWFLSALGALATYTDHIRCDDHLLVLLASISMVVFIFFLGACIMISVLLADFCFGPDGSGPAESLLLTAEKNLEGSSLKLANYYLACTGRNPIMGQLTNISVALVSLHEVTTGNDMAAATANGVCNKYGVDGLSDEIAESVGLFSAILGQLQCSTVNPLITDIMHDALCDETVEGITFLWGSMCLASFFLWLGLLLFPCVTHHIKVAKEAKVFAEEEEAAGAVWAVAAAPADVDEKGMAATGERVVGQVGDAATATEGTEMTPVNLVTAVLVEPSSSSSGYPSDDDEIDLP